MRASHVVGKCGPLSAVGAFRCQCYDWSIISQLLLLGNLGKIDYVAQSSFHGMVVNQRQSESQEFLEKKHTNKFIILKKTIYFAF